MSDDSARGRLPTKQVKTPHVAFISYAFEDRSVAEAACEALETHGIKCWIAPRDILPGESYGGAIFRAINQSRIFILILSLKSNSSQHVLREVERAVSKKIPLLPFRIEDVQLSVVMRHLIGAPQWLDALDRPVRDLSRLVESVQRYLLADASQRPVSDASVGQVRESQLRASKPPDLADSEKTRGLEEEYGGVRAFELQRLAVRAFSEGNQDGAIDYLRLAISCSIQPAKLREELSDILSTVAVARVNALQGTPSDSALRQAAELLNEALDLNPNNTHARENQRILENLRAQAEQRESLLHEYGGAHAFELQQKAVQAFNSDDHESAIKYLRQAIHVSTQPDKLKEELSGILASSAVAIVNAAMQRIALSQSRGVHTTDARSSLLRAQEMLEEAVALFPSNTRASQNLSVLRQRLAAARGGLRVGLDTGSSSTRLILGDWPSNYRERGTRARGDTVSRRAGTPEVPGGTVDRVHFSVASPATVVPGTSLVIGVWAYIERQRQEVLGRIAESLGSGDIRIETKGPVELSRGTILTVRLSVEGLVVDDPEDTILWQGEIGSASFPVTVPGDASIGPHRGKLAIYSNGLNVARLYFSVNVGDRAAEAAFLPVQERRYRTAFASYASQDRDEVLLVVMGLQKGMPDLDVFLDVARLRAGQKWQEEIRRELAGRDIFYLFWSRAASQSEWVEKEWRCALEIRGIDYIDPVPMVPPDVVPPPRELAEQLHFNEWTLAYRSYSRLKEMFGR